MEPTTVTEQGNMSTPLPLPPHPKKNLYAIVRHVFLVACVLCAVSIFIFLFYQNGKSIYDNGI